MRSRDLRDARPSDMYESPFCLRDLEDVKHSAFAVEHDGFGAGVILRPQRQRNRRTVGKADSKAFATPQIDRRDRLADLPAEAVPKRVVAADSPRAIRSHGDRG